MELLSRLPTCFQLAITIPFQRPTPTTKTAPLPPAAAIRFLQLHHDASNVVVEAVVELLVPPLLCGPRYRRRSGFFGIGCKIGPQLLHVLKHVPHAVRRHAQNVALLRVQKTHVRHPGDALFVGVQVPEDAAHIQRRPGLPAGHDPGVPRPDGAPAHEEGFDRGQPCLLDPRLLLRRVRPVVLRQSRKPALVLLVQHRLPVADVADEEPGVVLGAEAGEDERSGGTGFPRVEGFRIHPLARPVLLQGLRRQRLEGQMHPFEGVFHAPSQCLQFRDVVVHEPRSLFVDLQFVQLLQKHFHHQVACHLARDLPKLSVSVVHRQ
mmetsp:Transcript_23748/g.60003  ORF Transcript_23748/g.60003 Transcript_23748/m.60003 type:complete len:321 (-) Transcript_23748:1747-2709(-)